MHPSSSILQPCYSDALSFTRHNNDEFIKNPHVQKFYLRWILVRKWCINGFSFLAFTVRIHRVRRWPQRSVSNLCLSTQSRPWFTTVLMYPCRYTQAKTSLEQNLRKRQSLDIFEGVIADLSSMDTCCKFLLHKPAEEFQLLTLSLLFSLSSSSPQLLCGHLISVSCFLIFSRSNVHLVRYLGPAPSHFLSVLPFIQSMSVTFEIYSSWVGGRARLFLVPDQTHMDLFWGFIYFKSE